MNFRPKSSNSETFKLLIFDLYLQCQKNGGLINGTELKDKFRLYKIDNHYTKLSLLKLGMITPVEKGKGEGKAHIYMWSAGVPTEEMIETFFNEVYLVRHISQESLREKRREERKRLKELKATEEKPQEDDEVFNPSENEQVSPTLDSWCLKFPDEKQYFSAFGLEMMRKIGRLFSIESVRELDGH